MELSVDSKCIHIKSELDEHSFGAISYPIYQTATFAHRGFQDSTGYDYSRLQNPTREKVEDVVAARKNFSE